MDISSIDLTQSQSEAVWFDLLHPESDHPTGVRLGVVGYETERVEAALRDVQRTLMQRQTKTEPVEALRMKRIAQAKAALDGVEGGSGSTATADAMRALMDRPGFIWITEQIEAKAAVRASFFRNAETP